MTEQHPDLLANGPRRRPIRRRWWAAVVAAVSFAVVLSTGLGTGFGRPADPPVRPANAHTVLSGTATALEGTVRTALESSPKVAHLMVGGPARGRLYCGVNILGGSSDGSELYVWARCEDIDPVDPPVVVSGGAMALVVHVNAAPAKFWQVSAPRQDHLRADIEKMFPPLVAAQLVHGNLPTRPSQRALLSQAANDSLVTDDADALAALLANSNAALEYLTMDGLRTGAAEISAAGRNGRRTTAILVTADGWRTDVGLLLRRSGYVWTHLSRNGTLAYVPENGNAGLLYPDGTWGRLDLSLTPVDGGHRVELVTRPPGIDTEQHSGAVWVLDPAAATLAPLRTQPTAAGQVSDLTAAPDGTVFVVAAGSGQVRHADVYATSDGGRTWAHRRGPTVRSGNAAFGYFAAGPHGRLAMLVSEDGATFAPWRELWTSTDAGRSWTLLRPADHPQLVSGLAYAPDGSLLIAQDDAKPTTALHLWRAAPDSPDLREDPALPQSDSLWSSGGVLITLAGSRSARLSVDGSHWRTVAIPAPAPH